MGCCTSREDPSAIAPANLATNSRTSIDGTNDTASAGAVAVAESTTNGRGNGSNTSRRPNANLRPPKAWHSTSRTWTKQQLAREREIFWETQVTGSPQIWAALRLVADMMKGTAADANDQRPPDLKGAKAVLEASGCTCPTGRIGDGVWDEQGRLYKLPRWVTSDPVNVAEGPAGEEDDEDVAEDDDAEEEDETKESMTEYYADTSVDKGKDKETSGSNAVTVTFRLSDRATDVKLHVDKEQAVKAILKRVQTEANMESGVKLRLAYMGRIMKDNDSLSSQNWRLGHVVNVLVFNV